MLHESSLNSGHNLHFFALAVQIVETKLGARRTDVVNTTSKHFSHTAQPFTGFDDAVAAIFFDISGDRCRYFKFVGVWIGRLRLAQFLDLS